MKALVGAFNQEKALVGTFSVIVQPVVEPMDRFAALIITLTLTADQLSRNTRDHNFQPRAGLGLCPSLDNVCEDLEK